jgi:hypothetical protein
VELLAAAAPDRGAALAALRLLRPLIDDEDCAVELGYRGGHARLAALASSSDEDVAEVRLAQQG